MIYENLLDCYQSLAIKDTRKKIKNILQLTFNLIEEFQ